MTFNPAHSPDLVDAVHAHIVDHDVPLSREDTVRWLDACPQLHTRIHGHSPQSLEDIVDDAALYYAHFLLIFLIHRPEWSPEDTLGQPSSDLRTLVNEFRKPPSATDLAEIVSGEQQPNTVDVPVRYIASIVDLAAAFPVLVRGGFRSIDDEELSSVCDALTVEVSSMTLGLMRIPLVEESSLDDAIAMPADTAESLYRMFRSDSEPMLTTAAILDKLGDPGINGDSPTFNEFLGDALARIEDNAPHF